MKALSMVLFVCALASAEEFHQVEGAVVTNSGNLQDIAWAKLTSIYGGVVSISPVSPEGRFTFLAVPTGVYTVWVSDGAGRELVSQTVTVRDADQWLTVSLGDAAAPGMIRGSGDKVSVAALRHTPTKSARRAAEQAQKLAAGGDHKGAVAALQKAIALDSKFVDARGNLGAEYLLLHEYAQAALELRQAIALDPAAAWLQANLASALWQSGNPEEAEQVARKAVSLDGRNAKSHYILGWILVRRPGGSAEGVGQLERAARDFPPAHRTLADYYRGTGDTVLARREMERYLVADPTANRAEAEKWIESLR